MSEFDSRLREWYVGEMGGKAFFDALASTAQSDVEIEKWSLLGRLEATMAERLSVTCAAASIALPEPSSDPSLLDYVRKMAGESWQTIMEDLMPQLRAAVAEVREQASMAPAAHTDIAADFIAHEEALAAFVRAELDGEDGSPAVQSLLQEWSGS